MSDATDNRFYREKERADDKYGEALRLLKEAHHLAGKSMGEKWYTAATALLSAPSSERRITPELIEICELLLDYRRRNGSNFQLEKADDYLRRMDQALDRTYTPSATGRSVLQAIDAEPELPGHMPDEMWEEIKGDRDAIEEAMRIAVRQTKSGIKERLAATELEPRSDGLTPEEMQRLIDFHDNASAGAEAQDYFDASAYHAGRSNYFKVLLEAREGKTAATLAKMIDASGHRVTEGS